MTLYVDTSALLARHLDEPDADRIDAWLGSDPMLVTSRVTVVEARRNLTRLLTGTELLATRQDLRDTLDAFVLIEVDATTCELAAAIAEETLARSLDAIHLASARRLGDPTFLTLDVRQAAAARQLGLATIGA